MARSKDVLSVLGMLCISRTYRTEFFADPQAKAEYLVGNLGDEELEQIMRLAGNGHLPRGMTRTDFVGRLQQALDMVYVASDCPDPPCPGSLVES